MRGLASLYLMYGTQLHAYLVQIDGIIIIVVYDVFISDILLVWGWAVGCGCYASQQAMKRWHRDLIYTGILGR